MSLSVAASGRAVGTAIPVVFLALSVLALTLFGYMGVGRGGTLFAFDMRYLYIAGEMWGQFSSPYDVDSFKGAMKTLLDIDSGNFAYPPNAFPVAMILSPGSVELAQILIGALNLVAIGILVAFIHLGAAKTAPDGGPQAAAIALIASSIVIGNPFSAHVVWMGQMTLISAACVYGCWLMADRRLDVVAGVLLGISAFKPQLAFLVGLWFVLDRRWVLVATAAATTVVISAWPMITNGLSGSWLAWAGTLGEYQDTIYNVVTFKHVFGIRSVLASVGIEVPSLILPGIAALIGLFMMRRHYETIWLINAILLISFLFLFAHDYDLAPVAVIACPLLLAARRKPGLLLLICALAFVVFFPQRIWEKLDLALMARTREIAVLGILALYLVVCRKPQEGVQPSLAAAQR